MKTTKEMHCSVTQEVNIITLKTFWVLKTYTASELGGYKEYSKISQENPPISEIAFSHVLI